MSEIEIGEYVRLKSGYIVGKAIGIVPEHGDETGYCPESVNTEELDTIFYDEIAKHSKKITGLIEIKDMVRVRNLKGDIFDFTIEIFDDKTMIDLQLALDNNELKLLSILTKKQYNQNCYRLEGIKCFMQ